MQVGQPSERWGIQGHGTGEHAEEAITRKQQSPTSGLSREAGELQVVQPAECDVHAEDDRTKGRPTRKCLDALEAELREAMVDNQTVNVLTWVSNEPKGDTIDMADEDVGPDDEEEDE